MKKKWFNGISNYIIKGGQYLFSKEEFRTVDNYRFMERE